MKNHIQSHHTKIKFSCSKCKFEDTSLHKLNVHKKLEHKRNSSNMKSSDLQLNPKSDNNDLCKDFKSDLKNQTDQGQEKEKYSCSICDNEYYQKDSLKEHLKSHSC